jgi:ribonuclease HII
MALLLPNFDYENAYSLMARIAGIDEAGRGPWAGPVVAGAAIFYNREDLPSDLRPLIRDSKTLSRKQREQAYDLLLKYEGDLLCFAPGEATVEEIDRLNIQQATFLAMSRAFEALPLGVDYALVDGNRKPSLGCPVQTIIKGDRHSLSIAAASIVAKVIRDRIMDTLHVQYPDYGWNTNSGYGTKIHQEALQSHGVTPHHRRSYAPIAILLAA